MTFARMRKYVSPVFGLATRLSPNQTQCNILALGFKVISIRNRAGDMRDWALQRKKKLPDSSCNIWQRERDVD